jgi:hypothetical protein
MGSGQSHQKYEHRLVLVYSTWSDNNSLITLTQRVLTHGLTSIGPLPRHKRCLLTRTSGVGEGRVRANQMYKNKLIIYQVNKKETYLIIEIFVVIP